MRESVINVLFYLFDDILTEQDGQEADLNQMAHWLSEAGFAHEDVGRAMDWFCELGKIGDYQPIIQTNPAVRIFSPQEAYFIDEEGQDFLRGLCRAGVLDTQLQETVIERAIALEEPLSLETLHWVVMMVIMNTGTSETVWESKWSQMWLVDDDDHSVMQ